MNVQDYMSSDLEVCHGKPCFKGTRILVSLVLEMLEGGATIDDVLVAYPNLTRPHIQAALHLASQLIDNERFAPFRAA